MENVKWLLLRLKAYWLLVLLSLVGSVLEAGGTAGVSLVVKSLVDRVFFLKEGEELVFTILKLMAFVLVAQLGSFTVSFFSNLYTEREMQRLREEAFIRLLRVDYSVFLRVPPGEFLSKMLSDMNLYRNLIGSYSIKIIREPFSVLFLVGVLLYRDWLLTLLMLFLLPVLTLAVRYFGGKRGKHVRRSQEGYADISDKVFSSFGGFESIRSLGAERRFQGIFSELNRRLFYSSFKSELYFAINSVFNYTFGYSAVAMVILYGGYRVVEGALTAGDFISYITALVFLQRPLVETQKGIMELRASLPVLERIRELLSLPEEKEGRLELGGPIKDIKASGLVVRVNGQELIRDVSIEISRGEKVGIMGETGSGKSSFLKVLAGLLPYEGSLRINGVELKDINRTCLRSRVQYLSQEPFVYPGTVRENLLISRSNATDEELWEALRLACCDFVKDLEQWVSHRTLSGGERQRLALARVFLRDADLLLLDEVTSALDAKKEEEVLENLLSFFRGSTVILVAHRFSNIRRCDRVFVFGEGTPVFEGKPKEAIDFFLQRP
ncbi:MAG: ABC transporter ATP-binding protein [Acidobacteria bacterium]|nr:MAG: ABC transporter ATP-binding protein [Acidobacteriota bacterium]